MQNDNQNLLIYTHLPCLLVSNALPATKLYKNYFNLTLSRFLGTEVSTLFSLYNALAKSSVFDISP